MDQQAVRRFVERYLAAFSTHIVESHPAYLTAKLPVEVDKDIGNRPFYWSWVERMNIPPQPMVLTFFFDPDQVPTDMRGEPISFGSGRLQQIFQSTRKHGRFVCLYEQAKAASRPTVVPRRSTPLIPWLGLNLKISFVCDKKRDMLAYLGVNLHRPQIVRDFYPFVRRLSLSPAIPDYFYTLERRLSLHDALALIEQEVDRLIAAEDQSWSDQARQRLHEELEILEAYYAQLEAEEPDEADDGLAEEVLREQPEAPACDPAPNGSDAVGAFDQPPALAEPKNGRILDFLRQNGIPETPKEQIVQTDWKTSTPREERARRIAELKWQYEPRIEVQLINGGLFYLATQPLLPDKAVSDACGRKM